eukprot:11156409-Lingulodinium_polyedra.AAC.1
MAMYGKSVVCGEGVAAHLAGGCGVPTGALLPWGIRPSNFGPNQTEPRGGLPQRVWHATGLLGGTL